MSDLFTTITTPNGVKYEQPLGLYVIPGVPSSRYRAFGN